MDVFPDAKKLSSSDESFLQGKSWSGQTTLTFSSVREPLRQSLRGMRNRTFAAGSQQDRSLQGFKPTWFVVSGDLGPEANSSLGFYTKRVKQDRVIVIMPTFHSARRRLPRCREVSTDIRLASSPEPQYLVRVVNSQRLELPIRVPETRSAFHPHAQRNAFRRRDVRQQSRSFARWNQSLRRSPNSSRLC